MVNPLLISLLCAAAGAPPAALGVVRAPSGPVLLEEGGAARAARSGDLVRPGVSLETRDGGWVELHLLGFGRLRLSSETRVVLEGDREALLVRLLSGRAWLQRGGAERSELVAVLLGAGHRAEVWPASSVVVEHTGATGGAVVAHRGAATVIAGGGARVEVPAGRVVNTDRADGQLVALRGGGGVMDLVVAEARGVLGDLMGFESFLVRRSVGAALGAARFEGVGAAVRTLPEVSGSHAGPAGRVMEQRLRPAPFFESEVPPRGPNVRVEVSFGE